MSEVATPTILGFAKSNVLAVTGLAGAALIGYCVYFDHKRRSAPDYKDKIRQNRREKARSGAGAGMGASSGAGPVGGAPDPTDATGMQAFFLQEVQLGEEMMTQGNVEQGSIHIANAVALCGQSQQLLQIFQQTLPPDQFAAVIEKLPGTRERLSAMFGGMADAGESEGPAMTFMQGAGEEAPPAQIQEIMDDDDLE